MRILAGVGAWLLGVATATAGSLLAVSLLGQGIAVSTSQQLTAAAVSNALAAEASETQAGEPAEGSSRTPKPSSPPSHSARQTPVQPDRDSAASATLSPSPPSVQPTSQSASASATSTATATATATATVLSSAGGTVVAECPAGRAYLMSWSPDPGYEVGTVVRGPAVTARVTFNSDASSVTMSVSCSAGVPTAVSSTGGYGGGTDDGHGGADELAGER